MFDSRRGALISYFFAISFSSNFSELLGPVMVKSSPSTVTYSCFASLWKLHGDAFPVVKPSLLSVFVYSSLQF